ncbi:methylated-DNA--[protein]-cysteine S-methyltransferase [Ruminococcus sp.]
MVHYHCFSDKHILCKNYIYHYNPHLGSITLASDGKSLTGLWLDGQKYFPYKLISESIKTELPIFTQTCNWLDTYFSVKVPDFTPPISLNTTPFRKVVYEVLLSIPYGQTMTYGEIANIIAKQKGIECMSAQAVGGVVGHNPISIIIPCHRVVGTDGSLTGYAGGPDKKIELLKLEKVL